MTASIKHRIVIVGGGSAGISVASRLRRHGESDVAVIDPAVTHYYQPLWTLVGGGCAPVEESARPQARVMPQGVAWLQQAVETVDPEASEVTLDDGSIVGYDYLVMCPGIQLDWGKIVGLGQTLGRFSACPRGRMSAVRSARVAPRLDNHAERPVRRRNSRGWTANTTST